MDTFLYKKQLNSFKIQKIYYQLKADLSKHFKFEYLIDGSTAFRIHLNMMNYQLSIAYPFDMQYGYCETALCFKGNIHKMIYEMPYETEDRMIFIERLGYNDIKRFDSYEELLDEIYILFFRFEKIKNTLRKAILKYRAKKYIQAFILEYKDHFMAKPFGKLYFQSLYNFEKISNN